MWPTLLTPLLLVFVTTTYADAPQRKTTGEVDQGYSKLAVNAFLIGRHEKLLDDIREKIRKAAQVDHQRTYRDLQARVEHLEGSSCQENEFECGQRSSECVSELFVCDGRKDCSNGYDEDEAVCSIEPALAGRTYSGTVHWTSCETREDHGVNITIIGYRIRKYSSSIIWMKALIEASFPKGDKQILVSHTAFGHYKFARRQMVLLGEGVGWENAAYCDFNEGEDKVTKCNLKKVSTLEHCATMYLQLLE